MLPKLELLVHYWQLVARHARLGEPLAEGEHAELLALMQLVTSETPWAEGGPERLPVQIIGGGGARAGELCELSPRGIVATAVASFPVGARVVVRVIDAVAGVELGIPCRVEREIEGSPATMVLRVDGMPMHTAFEVQRCDFLARAPSPRRAAAG
jgi:hypothetical protein